MFSWSIRPTKIDNVTSDIDYIMCIDENGSNSNIDYILKRLSIGREVSDDEKFFTITGCIFTKKHYEDAKKMINKLKNKYWPDGMYFDKKINKNKAVCFHSREIRKRENSFSDNVINYNEFMIELTEVMKKIECKIISISINLYEYIKRGYTHDVYNVAFDFLLERYIFNIASK